MERQWHQLSWIVKSARDLWLWGEALSVWLVFPLRARRWSRWCLVSGKTSEEHCFKNTRQDPNWLSGYFLWGWVAKGRKWVFWPPSSCLTWMWIFFMQKEGNFLLNHCEEIKQISSKNFVDYNVWTISSLWCFRFPTWGGYTCFMRRWFPPWKYSSLD